MRGLKKRGSGMQWEWDGVLRYVNEVYNRNQAMCQYMLTVLSKINKPQGGV